eukprot:TRINITY_DN7612_c0_g1_i5.p1 TRINITY_DN7612_c0_g1~~TRINITY_DN7612_c0_g1_i5.p1  ORF type:complete len:315 (-),score=26.25 TRINITY_DN7612_c0_g1_i5:130-1074(-)
MVTGKCTCGKCKWPQTQPIGLPFSFDNRSQYQRDFKHHRTASEPETFRPTSNPSRFVDARVEGESVYRHDYKRHPIQPKKTREDDENDKVVSIPFGGTTSYGTSFVGFKPTPEMSFKPTASALETKIPFLGRSTYADNFSTVSQKADKFILPNRDNLFTPEAPFMGKSFYKSDYIPHALKKDPRFSEMDNLDATPSLPGHWATENSTMYKPIIRKPCPAREMLRELAESSRRVRDVLSTLRQAMISINFKEREREYLSKQLYKLLLFKFEYWGGVIIPHIYIETIRIRRNLVTYSCIPYYSPFILIRSYIVCLL